MNLVNLFKAACRDTHQVPHQNKSSPVKFKWAEENYLRGCVNCPFFWGRLSVFANITSPLPRRKSVTVDMWHNFDFGLCCRHHQRSVSLHAHKDHSSDCLTPLVLQFSWKGQVVKVIVLNRYRSSFLLFPLMPFQAWGGEEDNGEPLKVQQ